MKIKKIIISAILTIFPLLAFAQKNVIYGMVTDSTNRNPLPFATIALFKNKATQPINATYSNEIGKFTFSADTGSYILQCSFVGYAVKRVPINVTNVDAISLDTIYLNPISKTLAGVTITATAPLIEQADDKIIFNTTADPSTKTETALEILRKTPFVSVDGNDNILVNGQSNFRVLLNGRETGMFSQNVSQALRSYPGSNILKIEVITNPSTKYDAEGVGGIINIITQKKLVGYNGLVSLTVSSVHVASGNINLNAKKGKVGISLNYNCFKQGYFGFNFPPYWGTSKTEAINAESYKYRTSAYNTIQTLFQNFGNGEISYEVDSLKTLSLYGSVAGGNNILSSTANNQIFFPTFTSSNFFTLVNKSENPNYNFGSDFIKKFKNSPEKEFSIKIFTEYSKNNSFLDSYQDNTGFDIYLLNNNYANNTQTTFQTDYVLPLKKKKKLETGAKMILRNATSDYESLTKTESSENYKPILANTNSFQYQQQVYSAYGSYNFYLKKWAIRTGMRLEHTEVNGNFKSTGIPVQQSYNNLIPNIQASTQVTKAYRITMSYGQRIQRPFINNLNSFVNNNDTLNISFGNPQLRPQLIRSLAFQNNYSKGKVFAGLTLTGAYSNDKIIQISRFNRATGVTTTVSENLGKEIQLSLNGNITIQFSKVWNMFINSNLTYTNIENRTNMAQYNSGLAGFIGLSNTIKVNPKFNISTFIGNNKPPIGLQGQTSSQWFYNITPSYKLFNNKLTITFAAARFLKRNATVKTILQDDNFIAEGINSFQVRNFRLGIVWNFGKLKENTSKKKGVTNDDVL